jgi:hypothetical protein
METGKGTLHHDLDGNCKMKLDHIHNVDIYIEINIRTLDHLHGLEKHVNKKMILFQQL